MTVDRYTKTVLTVIAACLLWQCLMAAGVGVHAQQLMKPNANLVPDFAKPVVIVGWGEMGPAGEMVRLSMKRTANGFVTDPTLPVKLPYTADAPMPVDVKAPVAVASNPASPIAVGITEIKRGGGDWEPISAKVEPEPTRKTPGVPKY